MLTEGSYVMSTERERVSVLWDGIQWEKMTPNLPLVPVEI